MARRRATAQGGGTCDSNARRHVTAWRGILRLVGPCGPQRIKNIIYTKYTKYIKSKLDINSKVKKLTAPKVPTFL